MDRLVVRRMHQAIELLTELRSENPTIPEYQRMLALCYDLAANWGDTERGEQAIQLLREIVEQYPGVSDYRYDLEAGRRAGTITVHVQAEGDFQWPEHTDLGVRSLSELQGD